MRSLKYIAVTAGFLSVLLSGSLPAQTQPVFKLDTEKLPWKRLSYTAKKVFGSVTTEIQWEDLAAEKVNKLLIPVPRGEALQSSDSRVFSIEGHSVVKPLWGSVDVLKTQDWYDPGSGTVLQRIRWRRGKEIWQKTYRFTQQGVLRLRKKPQDSQEANLPLAQWTDSEESFYPYNMKTLGCSQVLAPTQLLILASSIAFQTEDEPLNLCVFNKKQLHKVQIHPAGSKRLKLSYDEKSRQAKVHREELVETVKISFRTHSLVGKGQQPEAFSFLGLKGDFDIYIRKDSKLPVQVSGKIPRTGRINLQLREVELR